VEVTALPLAFRRPSRRYTRTMAPHPHEWDRSYEFAGTTYRECSDPDCRAHQQWICALDRWSDAFETPSPRERDAQRDAEREAARAR
jgi:hypothetical protein